jgi:hypothetical protein
LLIDLLIVKLMDLSPAGCPLLGRYMSSDNLNRRYRQRYNQLKTSAVLSLLVLQPQSTVLN